MGIGRIVITLSTSAVLAACGGDVGDTGGNSGGSGGNGNLRLVNASQDAFLDLYEGNTVLATDAALYGASKYAALSSGTHSLAVRVPAGTASVATNSVSVSRDDHQALVAYRSAGAYATTVVSEGESSPDNNSSKLRIFNAAQADAGNVDIYVTTLACAVIPNATLPTMASVSGLQGSFTPIAASTAPYRVCVYGVGARTDLRLDLPAVMLSNQRIATLILVRAPSGSLQAMILDQQGAAARV